MNIIPQNEHDTTILSEKMKNFISYYKVGKVLRDSNAYKLKVTGFCGMRSLSYAKFFQ